MSEIKLTSQNFGKEVTEASGAVLVDFWAPWCGPCKMLTPVVAEIAEEYAGKAKVGKVNIDEEMELAKQFRVVSIPTVIIFKDGQAVERIVGYQDKKGFTEELDKYL